MFLHTLVILALLRILFLLLLSFLLGVGDMTNLTNR